MPTLVADPTFLPLTVAASAELAGGRGDPAAGVVSLRAREADSAAVDCWVALLAGCGAPVREALPPRLDALVEATSDYAGPSRFGPGSPRRRRVVEARVRIDEAVHEGDGEEFAEAFMGYDQAVATVVVSVWNRLETSTA